jgi:hypothetical protein
MDRLRDGVSGSDGQRDGSQPAVRRLSESLRELTDAQRQEVAAASGLFEQLIEEVGKRETPRLNIDELLGPLGADGNGPATLARMRTSVTRAIDLYADLLSETFALYADAIEQAARLGGVARPASSSGAGSPVALAGTAGQEAAAMVWLHNLTGSSLTTVELRMTSLTAHDGATLDGIACVFSPAVLDVGAGSSASATLSVTLPPDAAAGAYHGLVLASGLPAASVPVFLTVQ